MESLEMLLRENMGVIIFALSTLAIGIAAIIAALTMTGYGTFLKIGVSGQNDRIIARARGVDDKTWKKLDHQQNLGNEIYNRLLDAARANKEQALYVMKVPENGERGYTIIVLQDSDIPALRGCSLSVGRKVLHVDINVFQEGQELMVTFGDLSMPTPFSLAQKDSLLLSLVDHVMAV